MDKSEKPSRYTALVWGTNPQEFRAMAGEKFPLPVTDAELHKIGVPARSIPRVRQELARLLEARPEWNERNMALKLAKGIAERLW